MENTKLLVVGMWWRLLLNRLYVVVVVVWSLCPLRLLECVLAGITKFQIDKQSLEVRGRGWVAMAKDEQSFPIML